MNYIYYIIRIKDMVILDGAEDMVAAIKKAEQLGERTAILQGCVITEVGQDVEELPEEEVNLEPSIDPVAVPPLEEPADDIQPISMETMGVNTDDISS